MKTLIGLILLLALSACGKPGTGAMASFAGGGKTICLTQCLAYPNCTITVYPGSTICPSGTFPMSQDDFNSAMCTPE